MSLQLNPVIGRELKERVRGLRAFVAMTVFVIVTLPLLVCMIVIVIMGLTLAVVVIRMTVFV